GCSRNAIEAMGSRVADLGGAFLRCGRPVLVDSRAGCGLRCPLSDGPEGNRDDDCARNSRRAGRSARLHWRRRPFRGAGGEPEFRGQGSNRTASTGLQGARRRDARAGACAHAEDLDAGTVSEPEVEQSDGGRNREDRISGQRKQGHDFHEGQPQLSAMRILGGDGGDFRRIGVPYATADVLSDPELRDAIKRYSNWPTIPQVYINGKFVGGCDIVRELHETGELEPMVKAALGGTAHQ